MTILAIETSCDETAIAVVEATGDPSTSLRAGEKDARFRVLGDALLSQIDLHRPYGGVYPNLAKREHAKNLVPILGAALEEAELLREDTQALPDETRDAIAKLLEREPTLDEQLLAFLAETEPPAVDAIAVTAGPGLEPALWVGINFAKALSLAWQKPVVAVNHMEGHVMAALAQSTDDELIIKDVAMPVLALLISGGHTELVLMRDWLSYELVGETLDDAVGEAFDKTARMLDLPYPGGPEISKLAEALRDADAPKGDMALPRPMLHENNCDFSFSGLKTAVLTLVKKNENMTEEDKKHLAREFEDAVAEVLLKKSLRALDETGASTLVLGGGVSANMHIRRTFTHAIGKERSNISLRIPSPKLTTDNAVMIALAGYYHALRGSYADLSTLAASGTRSLAQ